MQIDHSGIIKGAEHAAGYAEDLRIVAIDNDPISLKQIGDYATVPGTAVCPHFQQFAVLGEIGRASCRERVCKQV